MEKHTLFELNEYIRRVLALNLSAPLWVSCEIHQLRESRGHCFLNLIEKAEAGDAIVAQSEAIIWQQQYRRLQRKLGKDLALLLREGTQVLLQARVDFSERYGLKLIVEDIDLSYTMGQLELQRRAIRKRLEEEQLIGKNRRLPLPPVLQRLAVISSESAAGLQDFLRQLEGNEAGYCFQVKLFPAAMQGAQAAVEVARQLARVQQAVRPYDGAVIVRGGGARLDLAAFDDYELCRAVATARLPVFTGIGHEVDEVLLDLTAHTALKTPTAVAEYLLAHNLRFEAGLSELAYQLGQLAQQKLRRESLALERVGQAVPLLAGRNIRQQRQQLDSLQQQIAPALRRRQRQEQERIRQYEQFVQLLSPAATLKRGYSITLKDGQAVAAAAGLKPGDYITTRFSDGEIKSKVE